jgi:hypothetical protein
MKTLACLVWLLAVVAGVRSQTFWYIDDGGSVTNYTNYTAGATAATLSGLPLRVRTGATIFQNETVASITGALVVIGDTAGMVQATLLVETAQSPVFVVGAGGRLTFRDTQIWSNGTVFNTQLDGQLVLSRVFLWMGGVGVSVQNTPGSGTGLVADHLQCANMGSCLLYLTTNAVMWCSDCRFVNARTAGVSVTSTTPSAISGLAVVDSVWVNIQFFVSVQPTPLAIPVQYPLPSNWAHINNNFILNSYDQDCVQPTQSQSPSPIPLGGGGGGTCPACPKCFNNTYGPPTIWIYVIGIILLIAAIALAAMSMESASSRTIRIIAPSPVSSDKASKNP